jgi:cytochrome c peroxidase
VCVLAGCSVESGALKSFAPLPKSFASRKNPSSDDKVRLGRMLYYDPRLSKSQTVSCNTCHPLDRYGADGNPVSTGHRGLKGNRNSPTVYNAAGQIAQFWDGRAADVEEQSKGPVTNPVEMAMPNSIAVVAVLKSIPDYVGLFKEAFPGEADPVTFDNMAKAIGAFERGLITPSRWDKYLNGDDKAVTPEEKAGFDTFTKTGCGSCHAGPLAGGNIYQRLGISNPWPDDTDMGIFMISGKASDKMMFKVPSLRNVAETAPYFHNGKVATLEEAVRKMGHYQLGKELTADEVRGIVLWLRTLTGEIPKDYVKPPALPKSSDATPKPDLT